jgi:hypothetical protein
LTPIQNHHYKYTNCKKATAEGDSSCKWPMSKLLKTIIQEYQKWKKNSEIKMKAFLGHNGSLSSKSKCYIDNYIHRGHTLG